MSCSCVSTTPWGASSANPGSSVQLWTVLDRVTEPTERVLSVQLCTVQYDTCTELYSVVWYLYRAVQCGMVLVQTCTESYSISTKDSQNLNRGSQNHHSSRAKNAKIKVKFKVSITVACTLLIKSRNELRQSKTRQKY
jgi:hypothetical protein